jgi:hypothetical protein
MADLGTKGYEIAHGPSGHTLPWYATYGSPAQAYPNQSGIIRGIVTELGTPVANVKVLLYYRPTGVMIGRTWTNANGEYQFNNLIPEALYSVVAQDVSGGTQYNDQIKAIITPGS